MKIKEKSGKLVVTDFDEFTAYRIASRIEEEGIEFYKKVAQSIVDQDIKDKFNYLIDQEKDHSNFFKHSYSLSLLSPNFLRRLSLKILLLFR